MDYVVLNAKERKESGKGAAKKLRNSGRLPAVMYNTKGEATMLDIDEAEFTKIWKSVTPTTLISLDVAGKKNLAFIKDTEYDIRSDRNLHVDFHVIDEKKPVKAMIDVQVSGNAAGVRDGGVFETGVKSVEIQCLPTDMPVRIVLDVSKLGIGESLTVKDLPFDKSVTVLSDASGVVARVKSGK